ncbi:hemerythrin domain-containing protein [Marichromatium gracile]|uniref:Cation-binding protein n=1 Tax=Marichromatium gracile TaxID=1048 RepID=A0ABR5VD25_MARGR|nr:hemerythrin domain-containing protein [Marichromatium gracile]KXX63578.1 cation-binding protein [Marichromatium gracile]MBO8087673.1 hemerythrin domain-containing protein [Marichromatium sp.]MCF1182771.1 hemerythrin domain-containing protein [Marichromatium gracile]
MHPVMTRLGQDHARLVKLLDLFETLLDRFHAGEEPDYDLMSEMLEYMDGYADTVHHPTEDIIFRRVLDKGAGQHEVFDVLMRQHASLSQINKRFRQSLDGILNEEVLLREDVEANGRELVATMRAHLSLEDREAFPIALKVLDEADWDAVAAEAPSAEDPLFGAPDPERFQALYRLLSEQAQSETP